MGGWNVFYLTFFRVYIKVQIVKQLDTDIKISFNCENNIFQMSRKIQNTFSYFVFDVGKTYLL